MTEKDKPFHHRSSLKQQNKPFKGGSNSNKSTSGRTVSTKKITDANNISKTLNKTDRKNRARMIKKARQEEHKKALNFDQKRIIVWVPLSTHSRSVDMNNYLKDNGRHSNDGTRRKEGTVKLIKAQGTVMQQLLQINYADIVLFVVHNEDDGLDQEGEQIMQLAKNQGTCTNVLVVISDGRNGITDVDMTNNTDLNLFNANYNGNSTGNSIKNTIKKQMKTKWAQEGQPCYLINDQKERHDFITFISKHRLEHPVWRLNRPYLIPETVTVNATNNNMCEMIIEGNVRNGKWKSRQMVHITGHGDFVCTLLDNNDVASNVVAMDEEVQEQVPSIYEPLPSEQEQQSIQGEDNILRKRKIVRVPEGTSTYQAVWMGNEDNDDGHSCTPDEDDDCEMDVEEQFETLSNGQLSDEDMNDEGITSDDGSESEIDEKLLRLIPDAVPLPMNQTVRERYVKYRGIDNIHTVQWTDAEVPLSAGTVYQFADMKQSRKHALLEQQEGDILPSNRIRAFITVPMITAEQLLNYTTPLWALLKHEDKPCWMNYTITPTNISDGESNVIQIKNKELAIALIDGFRLISISPLYSEISSDPVHRRLKHLHEQSQSMLTFYGPMTMSPNAPILLLREEERMEDMIIGGKKVNKLIAVGTLDNMLPRVILKGIALTGRPFRIHKRSTTVRNLFHHPSDVSFYKPIPLVTKSLAKNHNTGKSHRRVEGHIKDAIGEHGKCRVVFERGIEMDDVIALELWKRVWPRWETRIYNDALRQ